jgi:hypothetical protein
VNGKRLEERFLSNSVILNLSTKLYILFNKILAFKNDFFYKNISFRAD